MFFQKIQAWFIGIMIVSSLFTVAPVLAANSTAVNSTLNNLNTTANRGGVQSTQTDLPTIIGRVIGVVLAFVGMLFFCLILWAGFGWMLAKGNEEEIKSAKETIFGAVLGLMVVLGAYAITYLMSQIFSSALGA